MGFADGKRIAKNTFILYVRTFIMMLISLYTSRIVLKVLGVDDFGLYNVIGGIVVLFTFVNSAMSSSTLRFLNYEMGRGHNDNHVLSKIFSASITIQIVISLCLLFFAETIGLWFLNTKVNIPQGREFAAQCIYQLSLMTIISQLIRTPYNACIVAYEDMSIFAYMTIFEAILKLIFIISLQYFGGDKLIIYGIMMFLLMMIVLYAFYYLCGRRYDITKYNVFWEKKIYKDIIGFTGWSTLGSTASIFSVQGINIIFNMFGTVAVNAAMGVGTQIVNACYSLVQNFQMAFRPQIVKTYAAGENESFLKLLFSSSRISFYLMMLIFVPYYIGCEYIINLWLVDPPEYSATFSVALLMYLLVDSMSAPLWISAQAEGNIRNYEILISISLLLILPIAYCMLQLGYSFLYVLYAKVVVTFICHIVRLFYLKRRMSFPILQYTRDVMLRIMIVVFLIAPIIIWLKNYQIYMNDVILKMMIATILYLIIVYLFGIDKSERQFILQKVRTFGKRK
ncbi:MAG: lipopolysaccharide biosynthesis protein [Bacteroidaceae bacterium]|nr:lipopolysaccharide biosynthesis protein [Bacteroidaceae bacterium]